MKPTRTPLPIKLCALTVLSLGCLSHTAAVAQVFQSELGVRLDGGFSSDLSQENWQTLETAGTLTESFRFDGFRHGSGHPATGLAIGTVTTAPGFIGIGGEASAFNDQVMVTPGGVLGPQGMWASDVRASAKLMDSFHVVAPGQEGKTGIAHLSLYVSGTSASSLEGNDFISSYGNFGLRFIAGGLDQSWHDITGNRVGSPPPGSRPALPIGGLIELDVPIHTFDPEAFGDPGNEFELLATLAVIADSSSGFHFPAEGVTHAKVDYSNGIYWGGISSVTVDGVPLSPGSYSITSDSGVNYAQTFAPVPEPEHYAALAGVGLLGFAFLRRACKSAH